MLAAYVHLGTRHMGRQNKSKERLTKAEKTALKNGLIGRDQGKALGNFSESDSYVGRRGLDYAPCRTGLDTRRPAKSRSTESIVHAILFCVLVAIIVSWALGY